MTVLYRCDGCSEFIDEEKPRIEVEIVNASEPTPEEIPESDGLPVIHLRMGFTGTHHFCSASCIGAWAMDRALTEEPQP